MVGPGEVDEELEPETAEECSKYGEVEKCVIFEVIFCNMLYQTLAKKVWDSDWWNLMSQNFFSDSSWSS